MPIPTQHQDMQHFGGFFLHCDLVPIKSLLLQQFTDSGHSTDAYKLVNQSHAGASTDAPHPIDSLETVLKDRIVSLVVLQHVYQLVAPAHGNESCSDMLPVVGHTLIADQTYCRLHFILVFPVVLQVGHHHFHRLVSAGSLRGMAITSAFPTALQHGVLFDFRGIHVESEETNDLLHALLRPVRQPPKNMNGIPHLPEHKLLKPSLKRLRPTHFPVLRVRVHEFLNICAHQLLDLLNNIRYPQVLLQIHGTRADVLHKCQLDVGVLNALQNLLVERVLPQQPLGDGDDHTPSGGHEALAVGKALDVEEGTEIPGRKGPESEADHVAPVSRSVHNMHYEEFEFVTGGKIDGVLHHCFRPLR
mmetsp:Transcript_94900/g.217333  ORF Transcript_94900/g.217333 Transcript_94900/m.217333 type:complete len:360 (-) Transcript_94900:335-1414(-)